MVSCQVLDFSKQAFYKWKKNLLTTRDWDDVHLVNAALDIHRKDPAFGYRFISDKPATYLVGLCQESRC
jgi:putative transposase